MNVLPSVWTSGQQPSRLQRAGRYLPESTAHPAKMLPAIAAQAISAYTEPGELVVDPMCGIGTTLVEAVHQGRNVAGVEYEPQWGRLAARNLAHATNQGASGVGEVIIGDARHLPRLLDVYRESAALVLTSPPYGASTHGHVRSSRDSRSAGLQKWNHRYSHDSANLAHRNLEDLLDGFTQILDGCRGLLKPGGHVAVTVRPIRLHGQLVDLPGAVYACAERAGLTPVNRIACLLCGLRDGQIVTRASFFQMHEARRNQQRGRRVHVLAHEDLLVFQPRGTSRQSPRQREAE